LWFAVLDLLRRLGIGHGPDLLGERARGALATFQKSANLEASGLVTAETRQALRVAVDALIAKELAEAERRAELERQAELVRQAEIEKQAKRDRQAEQERLARQAIVEQERQAQQAVLDLLLPMATLPAGSFDMGCQYPCDANEGPAHRVTIRGFRIGKYSVTQAQWQTIMSANPSQLKGDERPVDSVSWYEAQEFLKRLNAQFPGKPYRLPTEAEWEYAARGGLHPDYCSECASVSKGKILEWVQDCYHYNYEGAPSDGSEWRWGPCLSGNRVTRGGPWLKLDFKLDWCERVTSRGMGDPGDRYKELGLRLAQDL
jgi:formylglycine-generating enzyme required for sulfatase activity